MRQLLITAMSAVLAHAKGTMLAVLLLGCLAGKSQGASIVRVTYIQNDQKVGAGIYTGSDGGAGSEPTGYWALIAGPPEIVPDDVTIVPDKENGRVATLMGKIHISLTIRNSINMGIVELDSLRLIRNDAKSKGWYVPADEYRRIHEIVRKRLKSEPFIESKAFTYRGVRFKTKVLVTDDFQEFPFKDGTKTNSDMIIVNVDNGKGLSYSLLVPHMIERYGFYEGRGTPYRVDPSKVMEVLAFLKPHKK